MDCEIQSATGREMETPPKTKLRGVRYVSAALAVSVCGLLICVALLELATVKGMRAQEKNAETIPVIRINVDLVQMDAVVTDAAGKHVASLNSQDFEVLQDGKPQRITNLTYITSQPASRLMSMAAGITGATGSSNPPSVKLQPADVRRTVAFVIDDLALSLDSVVRVRETVKRFVEREMQSGDVVAIVRTSAGMGALQQFTADPRVLRAAIDRVHFFGIGRVGVDSVTPLNRLTLQPSMRSTGMGTLGTLRFVLEGLREVPGRKSVIFFSENVDVPATSRTVGELVDAASKASAVIYCVDPRGVQSHSLTAADNTEYETEQSIRELTAKRGQKEFNSSGGLIALAALTGGLYLHNRNDLAEAVRQTVDDAEGYYLIGYHPDSDAFLSKGKDEQFHTISIRVRTPGLHVRTHRGFLNASSPDPEATAGLRDGELTRALRSPFAAGEIRLRLTPLFGNSPGGTFLQAMLFLDPAELKFVEAAGGEHQAIVNLAAMTFDSDGRVADAVDRKYTIQLPAPLYQRIGTLGLLYSVSLPVRRPGVFQMRAAVRDATSGRLGSANEFIEVPDLSKGWLALSSIALREQLPRDLTPEEGSDSPITEANVKGTDAVRVFKPGSSIQYNYQIYNAHSNSNHQVSLDSQTRLFRDGVEIYANNFTALEVHGPIDPKRLSTGGNLKLNGKLTGGSYVLQLIVKDKLAKKGHELTSQSIDFELQER